MSIATVDRPYVARMLRKVPEVTIWFWIIKVLCTTVGETAADYLGVNLHMGLTKTTYVMSGFLLIALFFQFKARRYIPATYWMSVVLISVVGTLITDNMVDNLGINLVVSTFVFSVAPAVTFAAWYASEKTLSIHSIYTTKREAFYWLAILFTFALGTAAGDLVAEKLGVGYFFSVLMFASLIGLVTLAYFYFKLNGVLAFWIAYILTRPLGASIGDLLSQPRSADGLGLGTTVTSAIFLLTILVVVIYLTTTKADVEELTEPHLLTHSRDLLAAAGEILGSSEEILAVGTFELQDDQGALMVSDVATAGATGVPGIVPRLARGAQGTASLERKAVAGTQGSAMRMLVAVTASRIHVLGWDGAGHAAHELMGFPRATTAVQITKFGVSRHVNLADTRSDQRLGLTGSTAPFSREASGDKLVVHLLSGSD